MRRSAAVTAVAAIVLGGITAGASDAAAAPVNAPLAAAPAPAPPPDLQRLEQAMLQLDPTSERFTATISVSATGAPGGPFGSFSRVLARAASTLAVITVVGEAAFSPPMANISVDVLGLKVNERLIGTTLYIEEPFISRLDGGRPWVVKTNQHLEEATGTEGVGVSPGGTSNQPFASLVKELSKASNVRELGARTVDGLATTAFSATVDLGAYASTPAKRKALEKLVRPQVGIEVFIAENGLPVRTVLNLAIRESHPTHHAHLIAQSDIPAIDVPVVVTPPPPAKTITEAQLERLEAAQLRRLFAHVHRNGPRFTG